MKVWISIIALMGASWVYGQETDAPLAEGDDNGAKAAARHRILSAKAEVFRRDLAYRMEDWLVGARDVSGPLKLYMKARAMDGSEPMQQLKLYYEAMILLKSEKELKPLPQVKWPDPPKDVPIKMRKSFKVPETVWETMGIPYDAEASFRVIEYTVDNLKQYAIITGDEEKGRPLIVFAHGAAFGVPDYTLPIMARMASAGYVVAAPSFRGEPLMARSAAKYPTVPQHKSEGKIENLAGEVNDLLGLATGLRENGHCAKGKYGIVGHSFGAGAALLATVRTEDIAFVVSYDAWLTNPFRFYWERLTHEGSMENKSFLWGSWEEFTKQPVDEQLAGLMERSIVHHADQVKAPLMLFAGGAYNGSAYHYSHKELTRALKKLGKPFLYEIMAGGGHNFFLYPGVEPAASAFKHQMRFAQEFLPPKAPQKQKKANDE